MANEDEMKKMKNDINEMKEIIKLSEDRMNDSVDKLSRRIINKSAETLHEITYVKEYVFSVILKEDKKLKDDKRNLEHRVNELDHKLKKLGPLMVITEHEHLNQPCHERKKLVNGKASTSRTKI